MEGNCHFLEGNIRAKQRVYYARQLLKEIGLEPERIGMYNVNASDAGIFAAACNEMTDIARRLGPNPLHRKGAKQEKEEVEVA
jgi:F420-non-reducing hydrogenase iron-sulfur subunit